MAVLRLDLVSTLRKAGTYDFESAKKHSIHSNSLKTVPIKRHRTIDRITANELCKQAGLKPKF